MTRHGLRGSEIRPDLILVKPKPQPIASLPNQTELAVRALSSATAAQRPSSQRGATAGYNLGLTAN